MARLALLAEHFLPVYFPLQGKFKKQKIIEQLQERVAMLLLRSQRLVLTLPNTLAHTPAFI